MKRQLDWPGGDWDPQEGDWVHLIDRDGKHWQTVYRIVTLRGDNQFVIDLEDGIQELVWPYGLRICSDEDCPCGRAEA